jgi:hypothetical protein
LIIDLCHDGAFDRFEPGGIRLRTTLSNDIVLSSSDAFVPDMFAKPQLNQIHCCSASLSSSRQCDTVDPEPPEPSMESNGERALPHHRSFNAVSHRVHERGKYGD